MHEAKSQVFRLGVLAERGERVAIDRPESRACGLRRPGRHLKGRVWISPDVDVALPELGELFGG